jgi:pimeloyl-ACP methyl ester carboxylesterase
MPDSIDRGWPGDGLVALGETRLEYRAHGPAPVAAPTIVMLHEGLGCVSMWRDFPERLAEASGLGVFVYSRPGYGRSSPRQPPWPLDYMQDHALTMLPRLLDAIGFRRGLLLGHSDGASIAAVHGGGCRDSRVQGLVLMAPHFFTEEMGLAEIARARDAYETSDLRERLARHHGDNVDCAFRGWNGAWLDPGFKAWNLEEYLPRIECPVLVIQGSQDAYGTLAQVDAARRGCRAPVETLILEDCGHSPHRDQPAATLEAVAAFAARIVAPD